MHEYLKSLYKPELIRILERLATDMEIYQKILDCRIGDINEERFKNGRKKRFRKH